MTSLTIFIDDHKMSGHVFRDCSHDWVLTGCMVSFMIDSDDRKCGLA